MEIEILYMCPECGSGLTPWDKKNYVCDACGYGKNSMEQFREMQKRKKVYLPDGQKTL